MTASPANFFFGFLIVSIVLWMFFILFSRLFAWMLSRVLGASVVFRVGGWKCLRDVVVKFKKGAIESVSAGEIKLSLRQSLVKLGVGFLSRDPKVQVLICDLEVVMRSPTSAVNSQKSQSHKSRKSGRGKWMLVANIARFLSVSVADMVLKTSKAIVEVKELKLDISKDGGTKPNLYVNLHVLPILVHLCESRIISDQSSSISFERCSASQASSVSSDRYSAALFCDELSLSSEFGHDRTVGIVTRNVEIISGAVVLNLDEYSFSKSKQSPASVNLDEVNTSTTAAPSTKKPHKEHQLLAALAKYSLSFPEKVSFSLPKLEVRCFNREHDILAENNITGIQLRSGKSKSSEETGESTRFDVQNFRWNSVRFIFLEQLNLPY